MSITLRCSVGELVVLGGSYLRMNQRAAWTATLKCASKVAPALGELVQIVITGEGTDTTPAPSQTFQGAVLRQRLVPGTDELYASIVGGAGKLATVLKSSEHVAGSTAVPMGVVVADLLMAAGETAGAGVIAALNTWSVQRWNRMGGTTARDALDQLFGDVSNVTGQTLGWRMLADGTFWGGRETWPAGGGADFIADQGDDGTILYGPNGAPLFPGTTIDGLQAIEVLYMLEPPKLRAEVRHAVPGDPPYVANGLGLYQSSYAATVQIQNSDGTLDVICDDARPGQLRRVPLRLGFPFALAVGIPQGTRVRIGFENGSPRGAFAALMDQSALATEFFALVGDAISAGTLAGTVATAPGAVTFAYTPPVGAPQTGPTVTLGGTVSGPGHKYVKGLHG